MSYFIFNPEYGRMIKRFPEALPPIVKPPEDTTL